MEKITDHIYAVPGMSVGRIYIIAGSDGLTLIDTSLSPQTPQKLEPQLKMMGYQLSDIHHILITHAHPDHLGGLAAFQSLTNAHTGIHHRDAAVVRGAIAPRPRPEQLRGFARLMASFPAMSPPPPARVDVEFKEGDKLDDILPGLEVVETFGHSPGHVSYWWSERRVLFCGDGVMRLPWGLALPIAAFTPDMAMAKQSVRKIAALNPDILCMGHGRPIIGGAGEKLQAFAAGLRG
ncbi:MAG: MBL fold metallo-hydrolase [Anaerolineaceae bacterium]|nr:MBL fold metallo-hydrolase [Anaerolineaceae bacterium]